MYQVMNPYKILVVDEDEDLCEILRFNLISEGYLVDVTYSAEVALLKNIWDYNLVLLDVALGAISGFKMAHIIRNDPKTVNTPIVFLSTRNSENDRLTGFSLGADDYITKPFSIPELLARIHAIISRINTNKMSTIKVISYEGLHLNLTNKQVILEGEDIWFTKKEFEILKLLIENRNRIFTREELLARIWHEESFVLNRTIDVNITRIRKKIGVYGKNVVTKLGLGYCFEG
jgi:two-component system, OmpR family, alkaline phosphatase synthesis response regulator PhoP